MKNFWPRQKSLFAFTELISGRKENDRMNQQTNETKMDNYCEENHLGVNINRLERQHGILRL